MRSRNAAVVLGIAAILLGVSIYFLVGDSRSPAIVEGSTPSNGPSEPSINQSGGSSLAVHVPSQPAPRRPPGTKVYFGKEEDFWSFAQAALEEGRADVLFEAHAAARECLGLIAAGTQYDELADNALRNGDQSRYQALQGILKRCHGFIANGVVNSRSMVAKLKSSLDASGSVLARIHSSSEISPTELAQILESDSASAVEAALFRLPIPENSEQIRADKSLAAMLAACSLGKDCSKDSYSAQLLCVQVGACDQELWSSNSEMTEERWRAVENYKDSIVLAIRQKRATRLFSPTLASR